MVEPAVVERSMTWEAYLALPEDSRAEYVDGEVLMTPAPSYQHQYIADELRAALRNVLAPWAVVTGAGWQLPGPRRRQRIPDVLVVKRRPDGRYVTDVPLLAVEVLSSNRSDDLVRKTMEYFEAGLERYWIADPVDRSVSAYRRGDSVWDLEARLDAEHPEVTIPVADGRVTLRRAEIFGPLGDRQAGAP